MNTAKAGQVKNLLMLAGVTDAFLGVSDSITPEHLGTNQKFVDAVNELVELRGRIVHTGKVPDSLRKKHVIEWRRFVEEAINGVDGACRTQCKTLLA
jgi:hypothetical protein